MSKVVKILDSLDDDGPCIAAIACDHPDAPRHAQHMRTTLAGFIRDAAKGTLGLCNPPTPSGGTSRGAGHMHLHTEVFLQLQGHTTFTFPQGQLTLLPGEALLVPPKLLHDESVGSHAGLPFSNMVISADKQRMSCHLAHEDRPGHPASLYLETCSHPEALRIEGWLRDAARPPAHDAHGLWPLQQRALLATALGSVARLLDAPQKTLSPEPPLLSQLRRLVQNRMGEVDLTVAALAQELGCTADYLSHLYSSHTGEHLWQVILQQRLARAARLLTEGNAAIKEVAWCCGFASASYFIRCFRQRFGATPKAYRTRRVAAP
jgi:AraC-like DNA-binding protein